MSFKLYAEMTEQELLQVDLVQFSKLKIGDRVIHANAGQSAGSAGIISSQLGTVIGHQNQGTHFWGGLCVTVLVQWDDGSNYEMIYNLAKKVG